ncbi:MAG TPA: hypothetical protein VHM88_17520 [Candidatus Acidoferrales bacterium]|nr:hypothetical protein [Candidatus Acidoferrales bacterium]
MRVHSRAVCRQRSRALAIAASIAIASLTFAASARAQDPFEIHIYEYEILPPGAYTLEAHLNFVGKGTTSFEGTVAPTHHQFHMTYELTRGITAHFSMGIMLLSAVRPGGSGLEYAGVRLLPHLYAPKSWHLPLDLGLVSEFSFQRTIFEENSRRVELRPILEKGIGRLQLDLNPVFERALPGPGTQEGWHFEPGFRFGYTVSERFAPSLEYYSDAGRFPAFPPVDQQIHLLFPGGDLKLREDLLWSFGVGVGLTHAGNRVVFKSRFEFSVGR